MPFEASSLLNRSLARRITNIDARQRDIEKTVYGYLVEMLRFSPSYGDDWVRFQDSKSKPPLLTKAAAAAG